MKKRLESQHVDLCASCVARSKSVFKELNSHQTALIDSIRQLESISEGQELSLGNDNKGFYCIRSGHSKLNYGSSTQLGTVRICGPGDLVGYMTENSQTISSLEDSKMCFIPLRPFIELQRTIPEISNGIIKALVQIISIQDERISGLENHSVKNRIASTLLSLKNKFGANSKFGVLIDVKIDRRTLAKLSGTVIESLARILTEMENDKIIFRQGRRIHVVNQKKLNRLASE